MERPSRNAPDVKTLIKFLKKIKFPEKSLDDVAVRLAAEEYTEATIATMTEEKVNKFFKAEDRKSTRLNSVTQ